MTIKLLWKYLRHDIEQLTHRYAQSRLTDNPEVADMAEFGKNKSDEQLEMRYVVTGVGYLRRILKEYLDNRNEDANDSLPKAEEWAFAFKEELFDSYALAELMHWFVVRWSVSQWMQVFSPNDAGLAKSELDDIKDELKNLLLDSAMPIKERRDVFSETDDSEIIYIPENYEA